MCAGYGTIIPVTTAGQAFCIVFAFFGIPLAAILLTQLGSLLSSYYKTHRQHLEECLGRRRRYVNSVTVSAFLASFGCLVFLILPAVIFHDMEGWSLWESFFCAFITLTTIGFGDYVPGQQEVRLHRLYKVMMILWIVFGLAFIALVMGILGDYLKLRLGSFGPLSSFFNGRGTWSILPHGRLFHFATNEEKEV